MCPAQPITTSGLDFTEASTSAPSTSSSIVSMGSWAKPAEPMLAKPVTDPKLINFVKNVFICEEKFDGERMFAVVDGSNCTYHSRSLKPFNNAFPHNVELNREYDRCIFDGELVFLDDDDSLIPICDTGNRMSLKKQYRVFDIQTINGYAIHFLPLRERKRLLRECLRETEYVKISKYVYAESLEKTMQQFEYVATECNGEGLILKRYDEPYLPGVRGWLKLKSLHIKGRKKEFDLFAHRAIPDKNGLFSILECGYYAKDEEKFIKVCRVSSGINDKTRIQIRQLVKNLDGYFEHKQVIVTIVADKITKKRSLRHPIFRRFRFDLLSKDINLDPALITNPE